MNNEVKKPKEIGNFGEKAVCRYLRKNKYRIIKRNYMVRGGEIDIIAHNKEYIVFVEVKTRTISEYTEKYGRPADAVTNEKLNHIFFTAKQYLTKHHTDKTPRIDVAEVYIDNKSDKPMIKYYEQAVYFRSFQRNN